MSRNNGQNLQSCAEIQALVIRALWFPQFGMDRIIESNHKNWIYCNKAECHGIYQINKFTI